jgi:N-formylglutamate deformylase
MTAPSWLTVTQGTAPLLVSIPHTGIDLAGLESRLVSPWLGRRDADWWIDKLYDFAGSLGATIVHTGISRTVIDVNRDPSGASLYPGDDRSLPDRDLRR